MLFVKDSEKYSFYGSMQELLKDYPDFKDSVKNGKPYSNKLEYALRKGHANMNGVDIYKGPLKRSKRK
jgi:hypothetical protein